MRFPRSLWISIFVLPLAALVACHDNDDVTGTGGALAQLAVDMPETVHSGVAFDAGVSATAVGVTNVHNGMVTITLPAPVQVSGVDASAGTNASFANTAGGGSTVTWNLNTLDSNSQSNVTIHALAALPAGSTSQNLTAQASMTADGIAAGELTATDNFVLAP